MFCSNCGSQIPEGSAFCPNCGTRSGAAPESTAAQAPNYRSKPLVLSTLEKLEGQEVEVLGLVQGSLVSSRNVGKDLLAGFKNIAGGEIKSYTELTASARAMALERMQMEAANIGADGILGIRYTSAPISVEGAVEVMVYGTAVKFK